MVKQSGKNLREIVWRTYFCLFTLIVIGNTVTALWPDSVIYIYYHVLGSFHPRFYLLYAYQIASNFLNILSLVPFYLYIFRKPRYFAAFWRLIFILRIIFEFFGHNYEVNSVKSLLIFQPMVAQTALLAYALLVLPSYIAVFRYSFLSHPETKTPHL